MPIETNNLFYETESNAFVYCLEPLNGKIKNIFKVFQFHNKIAKNDVIRLSVIVFYKMPKNAVMFQWSP